MSKNLVRENVPLSRFGVLVAQLESVGASASQQSPDPLLSFDLLSDLLSAIDEEPRVLSLFFLLFLKRRVLQFIDSLQILILLFCFYGAFWIFFDLSVSLFNNVRNLSCYGKENARMHCIHCSSLARGGQYGIWHQWRWLRSYLEGIVFRYTPERVVSKGFFLMLREANLKELPVGSKYQFFS